MGRIIKFFLYAMAALVVLLVIGGITFTLLFDPNDYRENIATQVRDSTGRELVIEGDLSLSLFPWLAVEIGKTHLGNAEGFSDAPFVSFDSARLSVRLLPLLLRREIVVGAARIDELRLTLEVSKHGESNWQDFADQSVADSSEGDDTGTAAPGALDIGGVEIRNAFLSYTNAQLNERYELSNLNITTGAVTAGAAVTIRGGFEFDAQPAGVAGSVEIKSSVAFDSESATIAMDDFSINGSIDGLAEVPASFALSAPTIVLKTEDRVANFGSVEFQFMDVDLRADVEAFSYADSPKPSAKISIAAFSPRSLMQALGIDIPDTADSSALGKLIIDASATVGDDDIKLDDLVMVLDATTFRGELVVPRESTGMYRLNLAADTIDLNRYMAPGSAAGADGGGLADAPVEIPADLIRAVNARGQLKLAQATMGRMRFDNVIVGINVSNGRLRINPASAEFFDGSYNGDIRINASGNVPVLSVNEKIKNVSLTSLGRAMFEQENLTGTINGSFQLSGRGNDMAQIQRTLSGNMSFTLRDGTWQGTDVWYELRRARAMFKNEAPPEPVLPPRTRFSEVKATGKVTDGILRNEDFFAELPFMQLSGRGSVNLPAATVDYSLSGRVFDRPEFMQDVTPEELEDLTKVVLPLRVTGPLASPRIGVDFEKLFQDRVRQEVEEKVEEKLKDVLEDLFKR